MRHTQTTWKLPTKAALLKVPDDQAHTLDRILRGLEELKYRNVNEGKSLFFEVYTPLFARNYDVSQYWERYKAWLQGNSYVQ